MKLFLTTDQKVLLFVLKNCKELCSEVYEQDQHYINGFEPQFEIGEDVIVHIAKDNQGPDGPDGNNYFVELGMFGKYKVIEEKAYNKKHPTGKSLNETFNEAK